MSEPGGGRQRDGRAAAGRGAAGPRHRGPMGDHGAGRGAPAGLRPGAAVGLLRRGERRRPQPARARRRPCDLRLGEPARAIDRDRRVVVTDAGEYPYDALVLATGSYPFVPPVDGTDLPGVFVYRTLDDLEAIRALRAHGRRADRRVVIGGGLLGLEAANALRLLGLSTHVVEFAPRLMPVQVDEAGGAMLRRHVEELGLDRPPGSGDHRHPAPGQRHGARHHALRRQLDPGRHRRRRRRHPSPRRPRPGRRAADRGARRRGGRRDLPHGRRADLGGRRVRGRRHRRGARLLRAGRARLRDGRGGRRPARRRGGDLPRGRPVDQAQAARRRRGLLRRRARPQPTARSR